LLSYPVLNLSGYLRRYKTAYFQALQRVTDGRKWLEWTVFLLDGIYESARLSLRMLREMQVLRKQLERHLPQQPNTGELLRVLLGFPYLTEEFFQRQKLFPEPLSRLPGDLMSTDMYEHRGADNSLMYVNRRLVAILETS
jgi:Fic family protein